MKYIEIDKTQVPYIFEINLNNETFQFEIYYNTIFDYFTVNLYKNHKLIKYGEKVVYNVPLFDNLQYLNIPKVKIVAKDTTNRANRADYNNMNEDVFLYVMD